jgi:hypothetical protein
MTMNVRNNSKSCNELLPAIDAALVFKIGSGASQFAVFYASTLNELAPVMSELLRALPERLCCKEL